MRQVHHRQQLVIVFLQHCLAAGKSAEDVRSLSDEEAEVHVRHNYQFAFVARIATPMILLVAYCLVYIASNAQSLLHNRTHSKRKRQK